MYVRQIFGFSVKSVMENNLYMDIIAKSTIHSVVTLKNSSSISLANHSSLFQHVSSQNLSFPEIFGSTHLSIT